MLTRSVIGNGGETGNEFWMEDGGLTPNNPSNRRLNQPAAHLCFLHTGIKTFLFPRFVLRQKSRSWWRPTSKREIYGENESSFMWNVFLFTHVQNVVLFGSSCLHGTPTIGSPVLLRWMKASSHGFITALQLVEPWNLQHVCDPRRCIGFRGKRLHPTEGSYFTGKNTAGNIWYTTTKAFETTSFMGGYGVSIGGKWENVVPHTKYWWSKKRIDSPSVYRSIPIIFRIHF